MNRSLVPWADTQTLPGDPNLIEEAVSQGASGMGEAQLLIKVYQSSEGYRHHIYSRVNVDR